MSYNNQLGLREKEGEITKKVQGSLENTSGRTTRFIYKVCGARFEDSHVLDSHMPEALPKRNYYNKWYCRWVFDGPFCSYQIG